MEESLGGTCPAILSPRQFLDCPMEPTAAKDWFVTIWNQRLVPWLQSVLNAGLKSGCEDPVSLVLHSWPFAGSEAPGNLLATVFQETNGDLANGDCKDPLALLLKLREAASGSGTNYESTI